MLHAPRPRHSLTVLTCLALLAVLPAGCAPKAIPIEDAPPVDAFALRGVSVIPMTSEEVTAEIAENRTLVVEEGRIVALGDEDEVDVPEGLPVIDGRGSFVMPGLWDLHVHLARDEALPMYLANGVTTIVSLGGREKEAQERAARIAAGEIAGPRVLTCGPVVHGYDVDVDTVRDRIVEIAEGGFDCVKVYSDWDEDTYLAAADAAEELGLLFVGHAPRNLPFEVVLDDGREQIVHLEELVYTTELDEWLDRWRDGEVPGPQDAPHLALAGVVEDLARRTADRGLWVVATEIVIDNYLERGSDEGRERLAARPYLRYVDPVTRRGWSDGDQSSRRVRFEQQVALQHFMLEVFREQGVRMALGTDATIESDLQVIPGWSLHEELRIMVSAGYTPYQALRLATVEAAAFMRREGEGVVRQDGIADLLILGSNPLEDVGNAADIRAVVAAGRWSGRAALDDRLAEIESSYRSLEAEVAVLDEAFDEGLDSLVAAWRGFDNPSDQVASYVERRVNRLGYRELAAERPDEAIRVFEANVEMFPRSANTYDSLAEAHLGRGDRDRAIELYRRALEVDPDFGNARRMLEELGVEP